MSVFTRTPKTTRRTSEENPAHRTRAGLVSIFLIAIVSYLIFARGIPGLNDPWTVTAVIPDTAQIVPSSPVRICWTANGCAVKSGAPMRASSSVSRIAGSRQSAWRRSPSARAASLPLRGKRCASVWPRPRMS